MDEEKNEYITSVAILTRRLKEGKSYEDFRKAWFHTTGFGVAGKEKGGSNRMFTMINVFDPREIIVVGISTTTLDQLRDALDIDVVYRGKNPLDDVIEPEIGRKFCTLIAEDDFSAVGTIPYKPPAVAGKETNMEELYSNITAIRQLNEEASKKRDAIHQAQQGQRDRE